MADTCLETSSSWASSPLESSAFAAADAAAAKAIMHAERIKARLKLLLTTALLIRSYAQYSTNERRLRKDKDPFDNIPRPGQGRPKPSNGGSNAARPDVTPEDETLPALSERLASCRGRRRAPSPPPSTSQASRPPAD